MRGGKRVSKDTKQKQSLRFQRTHRRRLQAQKMKHPTALEHPWMQF